MPDDLRRQLGLGSATAAVAGEAIGVGIFLTPAGMLRQLGSPFWLLLVWLFMGMMATAGALSFGGLAARYPEAGGAYVYLREAYGGRIAFLYGWMQLLVLDPGVTASLTVGMSAYAATVVKITAAEQKVFAVAVIWALAAMNIRGARLGAGFLDVLTWLKIAVLAVLPVWAVALGLGDWRNYAPFVAQRPGSEPLFAALAASSMAAFYSFGGWWDAAKIAGEVRHPERTMPRALLLGVIAVTLIYICVTAIFLYVIPFSQVRSGETFLAQAGQRLFGPQGGEIMAGLVILCVLGSLAALMILSPRVYYAMARDGLFFPSVAETHPRYGTPARAISVQAILASLLVALGTFNQIMAYFVFVAVLFLGLTVAGAFRLRTKSGEPNQRPVAITGYPYTPMVFVTLVTALLVLISAHQPREAALGVAVVALGVPAFRWTKRYRETARPRARRD